MDLAPTVLSYLGIAAAGPQDGIDLLPALRGEGLPERAFFVEFPDVATPFMSHSDVYAVRTATHKLVRFADPASGAILSQAVFDLAADPGEQRGRAYDGGDPLHRRLGGALEEMIAAARSFTSPFPIVEYEMPLGERPAFVKGRNAGAPATETRRLTPEQADALRALGYVGEDADAHDAAGGP
jgi:hypothetical protein